MITDFHTSIAWIRCQYSWGGATIRQSDGHFVPDGIDAYAVTTGDTIEIPETADYATFLRAFGQVVAKYPDATYVGVFHDDAKGTIDLNGVEVFANRAEVDEIAETHPIIGGAYHFATGDGYWPQGRPDLYPES